MRPIELGPPANPQDEGDLASAGTVLRDQPLIDQSDPNEALTDYGADHRILMIHSSTTVSQGDAPASPMAKPAGNDTEVKEAIQRAISATNCADVLSDFQEYSQFETTDAVDKLGTQFREGRILLLQDALQAGGKIIQPDRKQMKIILDPKLHCGRHYTEEQIKALQERAAMTEQEQWVQLQKKSVKEALADPVWGMLWWIALQKEIRQIQKGKGTKLRPMTIRERTRADWGKIIPSKVVLTLKIKGGKIVRFKARWCACGNHETEGVNGTYRQRDIAVPVLQCGDVKMLLTLAARADPPLKVASFDVSGAYLYGHSETPILLRIPAGMTVGMEGDEAGLGQAETPIASDSAKVRKSHVIELTGNLYGLHSAGAVWNKALASRLQGMGFTRCKYNTCLYYRIRGTECSLIATYIDDLLIAASDSVLSEIKKDLDSIFESSEGGWSVMEKDEWVDFLGVQIRRRERKGDVSYEMKATSKIEGLISSVESILGKKIPVTHTPLSPEINLDEPKVKLNKEGQQITAEANGFPDYAAFVLFMQKTIGSLMYLAHTVAPDIMFGVCYLARRTLSPTRLVLTQVKHILGYIKKYKDQSLKIGNSNAWNANVLLHGISDATWIDDKTYHQSTGGYLIFCLGTLVEAKSFKIKLKCLSSCSSEVRTMSTAAQMLLRYNHCLNEIKEVLDCLNIKVQDRLASLGGSNASAEEAIAATADKPGNIFLGGDNTGAIALSYKQTESSKMKHVAVHCSFLVQMTQELKILQTYYVSTKRNLADLLTKALCRRSIELFRPFFYGEDYTVSMQILD